MKHEFKDFSIKEIMRKVIDCLTSKEKLTRLEIEERYSKNNYPLSRHTWDNYKKSISQTAKTGAASMKLDTFYNVCAYTDVSADYLLGFIETKHKEQSADMAKKEFGLSDEAMERLKAVNNIGSERRGQISSDLISFILANDKFWLGLDELLPAYFSLKYDPSSSARESGMIKFSLNAIFEDLIDEICDYLYRTSSQKPLPKMTVKILEGTGMKITKTARAKNTKKKND
jgi:hypothetical protein